MICAESSFARGHGCRPRSGRLLSFALSPNILESSARQYRKPLHYDFRIFSSFENAHSSRIDGEPEHAIVEALTIEAATVECMLALIGSVG